MARSTTSQRLPPLSTASKALRALRRRPRTDVVVVQDAPLHATATSRTALFRFVDDVELVQDPARSVIDVRSASRIGYSDLGTNRRRVEALRRLFEEEMR